MAQNGDEPDSISSWTVDAGISEGLRNRSTMQAGTSREQLLARFHVQGRDGQLLSGAQAFLALWTELPGWRWIALAGRLPGASCVMERVYRLFLRWRPLLQRWAARWD